MSHFVPIGAHYDALQVRAAISDVAAIAPMRAPGALLALSQAARFSPLRIPRASLITASTKEFKEIDSFRNVEWPDKFPFDDDRYFARSDESPDILFYDQPRFVTHIDDGAIGSIRD